ALAGALDGERGAGFRVRLPREGDEDGRGVFDGAAQAEPGRQRDPAGGGGRRVAELHGNDAEAAALNEQGGGLEGSLRGLCAADPKEALEGDPGGGGGGGVEGVVGVRERAGFASAGRGGEDRMEQGRSAGGCRADDFGQAAARELDFGDAGGEE